MAVRTPGGWGGPLSGFKCHSLCQPLTAPFHLHSRGQDGLHFIEVPTGTPRRSSLPRVPAHQWQGWCPSLLPEGSQRVPRMAEVGFYMKGQLAA